MVLHASVSADPVREGMAKDGQLAFTAASFHCTLVWLGRPKSEDPAEAGVETLSSFVVAGNAMDGCISTKTTICGMKMISHCSVVMNQ